MDGDSDEKVSTPTSIALEFTYVCCNDESVVVTCVTRVLCFCFVWHFSK